MKVLTDLIKQLINEVSSLYVNKKITQTQYLIAIKNIDNIHAMLVEATNDDI